MAQLKLGTTIDGNISLHTGNAPGAVSSSDQIDHGGTTGKGDDDHTQYHTDGRALTWLGTRSTTDLPEGTNEYYTDGKADARIAAADLGDIGNITITTIAPLEILKWSGTAWINNTLAEAGVSAVGHTHDHGAITGLDDDDHTQYLLATGGRALTGPWNAGQQITSSFSGDGSSVTGVISCSHALFADNGAGGSGGGISWSNITNDLTGSADNGYMMSGSVRLNMLLPAASALGDTIAVMGIQTFGWRITQGAGQLIHFGNQSTTVSTGNLESAAQRDTALIVCTVANTEWQVQSSIGNITVN